MKNIRMLIIALLMMSGISSAQDFRVYKGDTINDTDKKGLKQGIWKRYYEDDTLFTISRYSDGMPVGTTSTYYSNGARKAAVVHTGNRSMMKGFHDNDTVMVQGGYVNLQKDGTWKYFRKNGNLSAVESYKSGMKEGVWKVFYANGQLSEECTWKDDKRQGPFRKFFENGKMKFDALNTNDSFNGKCRMFHHNGQIWFTGYYVKGLQEGTWIYNSEKGIRDSVQVFKNGRLVRSGE